MRRSSTRPPFVTDLALGVILTTILPLVGCAPDEEQTDGTDVTVVQSKLTNGYTTTGCSIAEVGRVNAAMGILINVVGPGLPAFRNCINASPLVEFKCSTGQGRQALVDNLLSTSITNITCAQLAPNVLAEAPVSVGAGRMSIDHGFLNGPSSTGQIAGVMAHEIMHNHGYQHVVNDFGSLYYNDTVPQQVRACVTNGFPNASAGPVTGEFADRCDRNPYLTLRAHPPSPGMHACPIGMYMTGVHLNSNSFLCMTFAGRTYADFQEIVDTGTIQLGMHNCPNNYAMTGLHAGSNLLTCAPFAAQGTRTIDGGGAPTTLRQGMHACPVGSVETGIHANNNLLTCAFAP